METTDKAKMIKTAKIANWIKDHGVNVEVTEDLRLRVEAVWTQREDDGTVTVHAEWMVIEATIKAAKRFLNY